jgi:hypothetical protein
MHTNNKRKVVLRIGLLLLVSGLVLWALAVFAVPAGACCTPPENACCGDPLSGCFKCASGGSGGGGGGGSATPVPPAPTPGGAGGGGAAPATPAPRRRLGRFRAAAFTRISCDALIPVAPTTGRGPLVCMPAVSVTWCRSAAPPRGM